MVEHLLAYATKRLKSRVVLRYPSCGKFEMINNDHLVLQKADPNLLRVCDSFHDRGRSVVGMILLHRCCQKQSFLCATLHHYVVLTGEDIVLCMYEWCH